MKSFSTTSEKSYNIKLQDGKYTINGITYENFADIPVDLKEAYHLEDRDGNGTSDNFDAFQKLAKNFPKDQFTQTQTKINLNGKEYDSWDKVPPELKAQSDALREMMDKGMSNPTKFFDSFSGASENKAAMQMTPVSSESQAPGQGPQQPPINLEGDSQGAGLRWLIIGLGLLIFLYFMFGEQIKMNLLS